MATAPKRSRQARALSMLENQLASGLKTVKGTRDVKADLTDADVKRIKRDIVILQAKL
jgi:hypothetical protein